jgi:hypothetical protein
MCTAHVYPCVLAMCTAHVFPCVLPMCTHVYCPGVPQPALGRSEEGNGSPLMKKGKKGGKREKKEIRKENLRRAARDRHAGVPLARARRSLATDCRACSPSLHPGPGLPGGGCCPGASKGTTLTRSSITLHSTAAVGQPCYHAAHACTASPTHSAVLQPNLETVACVFGSCPNSHALGQLSQQYALLVEASARPGQASQLHLSTARCSLRLARHTAPPPQSSPGAHLRPPA